MEISLTKDNEICSVDDKFYLAFLKNDLKEEVISNFTKIFMSEEPHTMAESEVCGASWDDNYEYYKFIVEEAMEIENAIAILERTSNKLAGYI